MLTRLRSALSTLFHGERFRRELEEEIAFHIDRYTEDLIRSGADPEEARREARLRFGGVEEVQSRSREVRGLALVDEAMRNLRFALRVMLRKPLFTGTFVLTLGLCVGAGTAVYSVVDAVLWRPLPYPKPDRLALVVMYNPTLGVEPGANALDGRAWERIRDGAELFERAVTDWRVATSKSPPKAHPIDPTASPGMRRTNDSCSRRGIRAPPSTRGVPMMMVFRRWACPASAATTDWRSWTAVSCSRARAIRPSKC
jgi:hypothetical protein